MSSLSFPRKKANKPARRQLLLEPLERRDCPATVTLTVDSLLDENDGNISSGHTSLREAVGLSKNQDTTVITFAPGLTGTIQLTLGELMPQRRTTIIGPGANKLTIDAGNNSRIFNLVYRSFPEAFSLETNISGLTLTGGKAANGYGGAIEVVGRSVTSTTPATYYPVVSVYRCVIENSSALAGSGAIDVAYGTLNLVNSSLAYNSTSGNGGAIGIYNGVLNVVNCTISNNRANGSGGAIYSSLPLKNSILNATITGNTANFDAQGGESGGALAGGSYLMQNTIAAGNFVGLGTFTPDDLDTVIQRLSCNNIVGNAATSGGLIDGIDGNVVGNKGQGTLDTNTILRQVFDINGIRTLLYSPVAGSPAIDGGLNTNNIDFPIGVTTDQRGLTRIVDSNNDGVATVDIGAFEVQPPTIQNAGGNISFTEGAVPTPLYPNATVKDPDSGNFNLGQLVVKITANTDPHDRFVIRAAGKFTVSGNQVSYEGNVFGTFTGGTGTTPLVVSFNSNAVTFAVRMLLNNIRFWHDSQNLSRPTVFMQLTDSSGGLSLPVTKQVDITGVNDSPVLGGISGSVNYQQNAATPVTLAATATLYDIDSPHLNNGTLTAMIKGGNDASNRILIQGNGFTQSGQDILYKGTAIGTLNANGGVGVTQFVVTFNANSTPPIAQLLVRSLQFKTIGSTSTTTRDIAFTVTDGFGSVSSTLTKSVNVTP